MRIFVDTNVLISATVFGGVCAQLLSSQEDASEFLVSEQVWRELNAKLSEKFNYSADDRAAVRSVFDDYTLVPEVGSTPFAVRDPKDIAILASALAAGAEVLVTGDRDLLELEKVAALEILTPRQLLDRLVAAK